MTTDGIIARLNAIIDEQDRRVATLKAALMVIVGATCDPDEDAVAAVRHVSNVARTALDIDP